MKGRFCKYSLKSMEGDNGNTAGIDFDSCLEWCLLPMSEAHLNLRLSWDSKELQFCAVFEETFLRMGGRDSGP